MQAITLNGQLIAYRHETAGGGPCIVFINAPGSDQSLWDGVCAALPRGFNTLTYDLRGHGLSALSTGFSLSDLADDLTDLVQALDLRDIVLCAASASCLIAQTAAASQPNWLNALVLLDAESVTNAAAASHPRPELAEKTGMDALADAIVNAWVARSFRDENPDAWFLARTMVCRTPPAAYAALLAAMSAADHRPALTEISVPTLYVSKCDLSGASSEPSAARTSQDTNAQCASISGVGHLPVLEAPARVAELITRFAATSKSRFADGMAVRRAVLGDAHVDHADATKTNFDAAFQTLITESAWGTVWASPGISRRERSMITLALLAALGNVDEIPMHVRASARTGASPRDIQEAFQHVAIYAGVPRANRALKIARQTLAEMKEDPDV